MKTRLICLFLLVTVWRGGASFGQPVDPNPPPPAQPPTTTTTTTTTPPSTTPATPVVPVAPVGVPEGVVVTAAPDDTSTNLPATANDEVISQIQYDNTPLPDAISALARMAKMNIIFDPSLVGIGATGQPIVQPGVSIRWEKLTAAQALKALLDNYGWQFTEDPITHTFRIAKKSTETQEPLVSKVISVKYAVLTNLVAEVRPTLSVKSQLIPDQRSSQLIVMTTARELPEAIKLIDKLDNPTRQVLIEAKLYETSRSPESIKGIDWTGTTSAQNFTFGNGATAGSATTTLGSGSGAGGITTPGGGHSVSSGGASFSNLTSLVTTIGGGALSANTASGYNPATAFLNADGVSAVLSFLNKDSDTESVALPRTIALDGVMTELQVIRNIPVFEQQQSAGVGGQNNLVTFKPNYNLQVNGVILNEVGVKLAVTPHIVGVTNVHMTLQPEISQEEAALATSTLGGQTSQAPIFNRRRITTEAVVPSGYTLVLGGLAQDIISKTYAKVPLLGDIPGLGLLFRHDDKSRSKQNLIIFVTPTIIDDGDYQRTPSNFLKTKFTPPAEMKDSFWDDGKPYDWTKPSNPVTPAHETGAGQ